jgi:ribosome-associated toxin RatA of RatAB toxin-antitoxin module
MNGPSSQSQASQSQVSRSQVSRSVRRIALALGVSIVTLTTNVVTNLSTTLAAETGLFTSAVDQLPASARATLRSGNAIVSGDQGRYVARALVTGTSETVWAVLTDYNNFPKFLPNIVSTKIIETNGNQKIVEQVDSRQVFLFTITSRVRLAITESDRRNKVEFRQIDGDLQSISGYWQIEPIAPYQGATPNQVLITQVVEAQPKAGTPRDTFYDIFRGSLNQTMLAVSREVSSREIASATPKMPTSGLNTPNSKF